MHVHGNAVLTVRQRRRLCDLVAAGVSITAAAVCASNLADDQPDDAVSSCGAPTGFDCGEDGRLRLVERSYQ